MKEKSGSAQVSSDDRSCPVPPFGWINPWTFIFAPSRQIHLTLCVVVRVVL